MYFTLGSPKICIECMCNRVMSVYVCVECTRSSFLSRNTVLYLILQYHAIIIYSIKILIAA